MVAARPERRFTIDELAEEVHLSTSRFKARFREQMGMPPGEYMVRAKVERAHQLLEESALSITDIAYRLGFSSSQYFATVFKRFTNMRPKDVRRRTA